MRYMMQNSQVERKFQTLTSNRQYIFQILNLENDEINNENDTFESEELQAFSNISKELPLVEQQAKKIILEHFYHQQNKMFYYPISFWIC